MGAEKSLSWNTDWAESLVEPQANCFGAECVCVPLWVEAKFCPNAPRTLPKWPLPTRWASSANPRDTLEQSARM